MDQKHILICGPRGAGKSFLIETLLQRWDHPIYGYITRSTPRDEQGYHSIYMYPAGTIERPQTRRNHVGDCNSRERRVNPQVFEELGVECLQWNSDGVIVMDEIGFMECSSPAFLSRIRTALDGDVPVIAAVKARFDVDFLNEVRSHPKAHCFTITKENREALYAQLLPIWESMNRNTP